MGISQLLPLLEKSTTSCHVSEFKGQTVAIDTYCWLHKGARSCALQLAKGEDTDAYISYCMKYVNLLMSWKIKPIMVFDGRHLPAKLGTEEKRKNSKKQAKHRGMELLRLGQSTEAYKYFAQCIDITPEMALKFIKVLREKNVDCIVAPYEADAQLAFLSKKGVVGCVISEDSDLLLFGCSKVMYKMDQTGRGLLVDSSKISDSLNFKSGYTFDKFRYACILSGCDYLDSLPGIGLKKALKFIGMTLETDPKIFIDRMPRYLNMRSLIVPDDYKEKFLVADATFKHQTVFDPFERKLVPLNPIHSDPEYCRNSGDFFDNSLALDLSLGNINPLTMQKIDNWNPDVECLNDFSIWSQNSKRYSRTSLVAKVLPPTYSNNVEKPKADYDQKIDEELKFYNKQTIVEPEPCTSSNIVSVEEKENSPVLSANPFIKKFSKFQATAPTDNSSQVVSRFFTSRTQSSTEEGGTFTDEGIDLTNQEGDLNLESLSVSCDDISLIECECILEVEEEKTFMSPSVAVKELPEEETNPRKRKLQGTEMQTKKKQLTIKDMFKKMNVK